jgi:hypothetical protein
VSLKKLRKRRLAKRKNNFNMNLHKIATYSLVTLTGMILATFAAYYVLNQFVYPSKMRQSTVDAEVPEMSATEEQINSDISEETLGVVSQSEVLQAVPFTGTLEAVNTGCFADGECFITVDGKHVTAIMGWSQETVGSLVGVEGFGDLEQYLGKSVEVSAQEVETGKYTLYGSESYYIKVLE